MLDASMSLDEIGRQSGTDKSSDHHNYLTFYERFFGSLRNNRINILEIGVFQGASLKMWERYFPYASIVGADINGDVLRFATKRTSIVIVDQSDIQDLTNLGIKYGPFDIIVEDGSHFWEHQITTLKCMFPFVSEGGYYVVEDLQTNYGKLAAEYRGIASVSCVEYLKKLIDLRVGDEEVNIQLEEDSFLRTFGRTVDLVAFARHVCLLQKSSRNAANIEFVSNPLKAGPRHDLAPVLSLLAHVGNIGDVVNPHGSFVNVDEDKGAFLQGFQIYIAPDIADQIEYKGRRTDGSWTDWVSGNCFVGTRGDNNNLTGVRVQLKGDLALRFKVEVVALFKGDPEMVTANVNQECVGRCGSAPIRGLQFNII